jgi:hypothetical protein
MYYRTKTNINIYHYTYKDIENIVNSGEISDTEIHLFDLLALLTAYTAISKLHGLLLSSWMEICDTLIFSPRAGY